MSVLIASSSQLTCLGSGSRTFESVLQGRSGVGPLRYTGGLELGVTAGYHIGRDEAERPFRAARWLTRCIAAALRQAVIDPSRCRVAVIVGTGLRELGSVEDWAMDSQQSGQPFPRHRLDFAAAVRASAPGLTDVVTLSNACSAGGHALAIAQDLIELGEADAVVAAGVDTMSRSMLTMIGRVAAAPTEQVRPFDTDRTGVLLGDGAAAVVVVPESGRPALGRLLSTGLSCDAKHETAPDVDGIRRAMSEAFDRAGRPPAEVGVVVTHGTGTVLNDPAECAALKAEVLTGANDPLITGVKGAVGHTSGAAALVNLDIALRILTTGLVPPVVGLRRPLPEGQGMRFVVGEQAKVDLAGRIVQTDAFGFGGVNAVTLVEAV